MHYTHLGRSGLKVSRITLGAMNFGELTDQAESMRIMNTALDAGINFFDITEVLARLDDIFPPVGEAPQAYAW